MPGPYSPNDDIVGPIIHQIALEIQQDIPSIGFVWEKVPDRTPTDNQVLLAMQKARVMSDTNGKLKLLINISAHHVFRRVEFDQAVARAYTYISPWLRTLDAWPDQTLGGLAMSVTPSELTVTQIAPSGQPFVALYVTFDVLTEFNIPLS